MGAGSGGGVGNIHTMENDRPGNDRAMSDFHSTILRRLLQTASGLVTTVFGLTMTASGAAATSFGLAATPFGLAATASGIAATGGGRRLSDFRRFSQPLADFLRLIARSSADSENTILSL